MTIQGLIEALKNATTTEQVAVLDGLYADADPKACVWCGMGHDPNAIDQRGKVHSVRVAGIGFIDARCVASSAEDAGPRLVLKGVPESVDDDITEPLEDP